MIEFLSNIWRPCLEIAVLSVLFYFIFGFIRGTRAVQVLKGLIILLVIFFVAQRLHLDTMNWLLEKVFPVAVLALIILFQPELRRVLASLGGNPLLPSFGVQKAFLGMISQTCQILSKKRIGALIALEDTVGLKNYIESGVRVDSEVSPELLMTLFYPKTPLHDGGVVIQGDRIVAAACLFPLTQRVDLSKSLGTRHRAAIGLSEESDAFVIVVSEETGTISVAMGGRLLKDLDEEALKRLLHEKFMNERAKRGWLFAFKREHHEAS